MLDANTIILVVPPILTAAFAYLVARKKNIVTERLNRAKIDSEIQNQALTIVRGVMNDMRDEFRREIDNLKDENITLKQEIEENKNRIETLQIQLTASDVLVATLKSEISTLQQAINLYKEENARLKKKQ
jgi:chromosome segregation ATPase